MLWFLKRNADYDSKSGCGHETKMLTPFYLMSYGVLSPFGLYLSLALRLEIDIGRQGMTYLTYFLEVRVEQRASTADRQRILFCANLVIWLQVFPSLFSSSLQDRLHDVLGRPTFLFPCGFPGMEPCP